MKKYFSSFVSLLIVILPVIAILLWHLHNQGWPNDDAADYMKTAYQQYLAFREGSFLDGLKALYQIRGWRPILFPSLATPFLLIFQGNILAAMGATLVVCFLVCQIYIYAIAKLYLNPFRAALVAASLGTCSANIFYSTVFFSEIAWLAFFTGFVFHLLKSNFFRHSFQATIAGIFLGLAMLVRPMETMAIIILPLIGIMSMALKEKVFPFIKMTQCIGFVILNSCLLIVSIFITQVNYSVIFGIGLVLILLQLIIIRGKDDEPGIMGLNFFMVSCTAINVYWWVACMSQLFQWTCYTTSFGPLAKTMGVYIRREGFISIIQEIFSLYLSPDFIAVAALSLFFILSNSGNISDRMRRFWPLIMIAFGSLLPIFILYAITTTCEARRIFIGMSFLLMLLTIWSLQDGTWRKIRMGIISIIVALQIAGVFQNTTGESLPFRIPLLQKNYASLKPGTRPDQNEAVISTLVELGVPKNSAIAVYTAAIYHFSDRIYEPAALSLAALTTGSNLKITYFVETGDYFRVIKRLREIGVPFLLIDVYNDTSNYNSHQPLIHFTSSLLKKMEVSKSDPPGLQRVATFQIGGRDQVLFRVLPSG